MKNFNKTKTITNADYQKIKGARDMLLEAGETISIEK